MVMCLIGPSGSGKSTFLRCVNHLEVVNARPAVRRRRSHRLPREQHGKLYEMSSRTRPNSAATSAWCFHFSLFPPHRPGERDRGAHPGQTQEQVRGAGTGPLSARPGRTGGQGRYLSAQLSGGQQQRVAIARALAMDPKLMSVRQADVGTGLNSSVRVLGVMRDSRPPA